MEPRLVASRFVVVFTCLCALLASTRPVGAVLLPKSLANDDHGGHYWFRYCDGQPDATALPPDPRSLVTPTSDKAVVFNVSWYACLNRQPATCGELRALQAAGGRLLQGNGEQGAGWEFSGDHPSSTWAVPSAQYNLLFLRWGMLA